MKASEIDKMIDMRESGKACKEIAEAFGISVNAAQRYTSYSKHFRYGDFLGQFECGIANKLLRAGIRTKEDLYDFVSKHGYIRGVGTTLIKEINKSLDRKISLMDYEITSVEKHGDHYFTTVHRRLQFEDEEGSYDKYGS